MLDAGVDLAVSFTSLRRFWAVAASRNSSDAQPQPGQLQVWIEVSEQHLDLLPLAAGLSVGGRIAQSSRVVAGVLVEQAHDGADDR
jgi:hypothetical protein